MKEDYLWDKTGSDPEIEKLENALQAFRYQETEPPAIHAKIVSFEKKAPRGFFQFAFAFAACAAFVIVSLGVWFQFSSSKTTVVSNLSETITPQKNAESPKVISDEKSDNVFTQKDNSIFTKNEKPKQIAKKKFIKVRKAFPLTNRKSETTEKVIIAKNPILSLTKEEKYAYDQLMLALSITSSKLKLVEDKIYGVDEPNALNKKEQ